MTGIGDDKIELPGIQHRCHIVEIVVLQDDLLAWQLFSQSLRQGCPVDFGFFQPLPGEDTDTHTLCAFSRSRHQAVADANQGEGKYFYPKSHFVDSSNQACKSPHKDWHSTLQAYPTISGLPGATPNEQMRIAMISHDIPYPTCAHHKYCIKYCT